MNEVEITIITPMYNSQQYILETINSVLNQTYKKWEWIIIDDASTDKSTLLVENYSKKDERIKLIKKEVNSGQANSRNIGLKLAKNQIIAFLDSDDVWDPYFLEKQLIFLKKTNAKICCSAYKRLDENMEELIAIEYPKPKIEYKDLLRRCYFSCLTTLFFKVEGLYFDEKMKKLEDYLFWIKLLEVYKVGFGNQEVLASYRIRKNSVSSNKIKNVKWLYDIFRKKIKKGFILSVFYTVSFIVFNIFKNYKTIKRLLK